MKKETKVNFLKLSLKFRSINWVRADEEYFRKHHERMVSTEYGYIDMIHFFTLYQENNLEYRWVLCSLLTGFSNKTHVKNLKEGKKLARQQLGIFLHKFCRKKV